MEWLKYGLTEPPSQTNGLDAYVDREKKKKNLITNTGDYLSKQSKNLTEIPEKVNRTFYDTMDALSDIPYNARKKIADQAVDDELKRDLQVNELMYPNANQALKVAGAKYTAGQTLKGNITKVSKPRKAKVSKPKKEKKPKKK